MHASSVTHADTRYRPSGRLSAGGVARLAGGSMAAATGLGLAYGLFSFLNPIVLLNFLALLGAGLVLVRAMGIQGRRCLVRAPWAMRLVAPAAAVWMLYVSWLTWILVWSREADAFVLALDPFLFAAVLAGLLEHGAWSLRSTTPTGALLGAIWLGELALLVGYVTRRSWSLGTEPFCERCEDWAVLEADLEAGWADDTLAEALQRGDLQALTRLPPPWGPERTVVSLSVCPRCHDTAFLRVEQLRLTSDGKDVTRRVVLVPDLQLGAEGREQVHQALRQLCEAPPS